MLVGWLLLRAWHWWRSRRIISNHRYRCQDTPVRSSDARLRKLFVQAIEAQAPRPRRLQESLRQYVDSLLWQWDEDRADFALALIGSNRS